MARYYIVKRNHVDEQVRLIFGLLLI